MIYNFSVYVIVKDEDNLLPYFIEHYFKLNFQHIYIVDDKSLNPVCETEYVKNYIGDGNITVISLDFDKKDYFELSQNFLKSQFYENDLYLENKNCRQTYILNLFKKRYKNENNWVFFCDVDEFLYFENFETIDEFLLFHEKKYDIDSIQFQWLMYGSSYHQTFPKNDCHLFENFILSDRYYNNYTKYVCKINKTNKLSVHELSTMNNNKFIIKPYENDLIKLDDFKQEYFQINNDQYKCNIQAGELSAFIAHYNILDLDTFIKRKVLRERLALELNRKRFLPNNFTKFNIIKSHFLLKYVPNVKSSIQNIEPNMILSIDKYNKVNSTNFKNMDDMIMYSYYNKKILIFDLLDNILPLDFNINDYKLYNRDLENFNDENIKLHYIYFGKYENRIYKLDLPDDFNVESYKELNIDLKNMTDLAAKRHYIYCGKNENRIYNLDLPHDFDVESYKKLNRDLRNMTDLEAKKHYIKSGKKEKRIYK